MAILALVRVIAAATGVVVAEAAAIAADAASLAALLVVTRDDLPSGPNDAGAGSGARARTVPPTSS